jgi:hypothetical protein
MFCCRIKLKLILEVATLSFTGDVEKDFGSKAGVAIVEDPG